MVTDSSNAFYNNPSACASQYYPATQSDFSTWGLTTAWYVQNMGNAVATTHFVIDASRNGNGPNNMQTYATAPYNQPSSVIGTLASGNWCNPPGAGLGVLPTTNTGVPLLDAYLWVKTPGQSDGQCDAAGGVRAWDYSDYTQPAWPTTAAAQALFDPLWVPTTRPPERGSPSRPSVGPGRQPASALTKLRGECGPGQGSDRLSRVMPSCHAFAPGTSRGASPPPMTSALCSDDGRA